MRALTSHKVTTPAEVEAPPVRPVRLVIISNPLDPHRGQVNCDLPWQGGITAAEYFPEEMDGTPVRARLLERIERGELAMYISGGHVPRPDLHRVLPGDEIRIKPTVHGGNTARMVAFLALMVVTTIVTYGVATGGWLAAMGTMFAAGQIGAYAAAAVIGVAMMAGGALLINTIFPAEVGRLDMPGLGLSNWASSRTYDWSGVRPSSRQGTTIPKPYGRHRVGPHLLAYYTDLVDSVEYLYLLYSCGWGPFGEFDGLTINRQPASYYHDVETQYRLGTADQTVIDWFDHIRVDEYVQADVTKADGPVVRQTSRDDVQGLSVTLSWPRLIAQRSDASSGISDAKVEFTLKYRLVGAGSWTSWGSFSVKDLNQASFQRRWTIRDLPAGQYEVQVTRTTDDDRKTITGGDIYDSFSWFTLTSILPYALAYPGWGLYALKIPASGQLSGGLPNISWIAVSDDVQVWNPNTSTYVAKPTDRPPWVFYDMLTSAAYGRGQDPVVVSDNGFFDKLVAAQAHCDQTVKDHQGQDMSRCRFNGVFDSPMSFGDAMKYPGQAGEVIFFASGRNWDLSIDKAVTIPANLYVADNVAKPEVRALPAEQLAGAIKLTFINELLDYSTDSIIVVDPLRPDDQKYMAQETIVGVTHPAQIHRIGQRRMNNNRLCTLGLKFTTSAQGLDDLQNDVIRFGHSLVTWSTHGTIQSVPANDTLVLGKNAGMIAGKSYRIRVRARGSTDSDTVVTRDVIPDPSATTTIKVTSPFETDHMPQAGDMYELGEVGGAEFLARVKTVTVPGPDVETVKITALQYDEHVYDETTPTYTAPTLAWPKPQVTGLTLSEHLEKVGDTAQARLDISWFPPPDYGGAVVYYNLTDCPEHVQIVPSTANSLSLVSPEGATWSVRVVCRNRLGQVSPSAQAPTGTYTVQGLTAPPADVTGFKVAPALTGALLTWDAQDPTFLREWILKFSPLTSGATWNGAVEIARPGKGATSKALPAAQSGTYLIKAVNTRGIESANAASIVTTLPATFNWNAKKTQTGQTDSWPDTMTSVIENAAGNLQLSGDGDLYDAADLYAVGDLYMYGGAAAEGFYTLPETDLGSVQHCRVIASTTFIGIDWTEDLYLYADLYGPPDLYGSATDCGVELQIRTKDDPGDAWSEWAPIWAADVTARVFQFRGRFWTNADEQTPVVTMLRVVLDMPDRVEADDASIPLAGLIVTFGTPWMRTGGPQIVGFQVVDGAAGDYAQVESQNETQMTIAGYDASHDPAAVNVKWRAVGW